MNISSRETESQETQSIQPQLTRNNIKVAKNSIGIEILQRFTRELR